MFVLKIAAIALCVASLQSWPVSSMSDEEMAKQHSEDSKRASLDGYYFRGKHKDDMSSYVLGNPDKLAAALQNILNSAWLKGETSRQLLDALGSLRGTLLLRSGEGECDLVLYDQMVAIVRMSKKYFEGTTVRDRMIRMLVYRLLDRFTTRCVASLLGDLRQLHEGEYQKQLDSLATFKAFLTDEPLHLIQDKSYPDNSPSLTDKLNLVSGGDQAWSQFLRYAAVELKDNDPGRAERTKKMPRKERITTLFEFVVGNSCDQLSDSEEFLALVDEVPPLAGKFVLSLFDNNLLRHDFQKVERYVAMYKVCMKLKDLDRDELMEKVELHTRENFA